METHLASNDECSSLDSIELSPAHENGGIYLSQSLSFCFPDLKIEIVIPTLYFPQRKFLMINIKRSLSF